MLFVNMHVPDADGNDMIIGRLYVDDGKVFYDSLVRDFERLMYETSVKPSWNANGDEFRPKLDPDGWLKALPTTYRGSYVWATLEEDKSRQSALPAEP